MSDIKITDGHLQLQNGDLTLVNGVNQIIQQIRVGLLILVGDWVLDETKGIDYIWGLREYPEILSAQVKRAIGEVEGVEAVLKYNFIIDDNNIFRIFATVKVGNSEIAINENINPRDIIEV